MSSKIGMVIVLAMVMALVVIAAIFLPVIFGSAESSIDVTNNTTKATLNTVTPIILSTQTILWIIGALAGLFMLVVILVWRGR